MTDRRDELAANLAAVRAEIAEAARNSGRDLTDITLIAVTKNHPASDAAMLAELGLSDLGENRAQEALTKASESAALTNSKITWHFIGQLQRNKVRSVLSFAGAIHSIDRLALVNAINAEIAKSDRHPELLIQVSLDPEPTGRGGAFGDEVFTIAEAIVEGRGNLVGLMAVAPLAEEPARAFARLAEIRERFIGSFPAAKSLSAGMSGDYVEAINFGATHLRIGAAILGSRQLLR